MSEEEMKAIEYIKYLIEDFKRHRERTLDKRFDDRQINTYTTILNLIENQQKKIEELKEENRVQRMQLNDAFSRGFIHKSKIEESYLDMEKEYARKVYDNNYDRTEVKKEEMYKRQVYEELLKEE